MQKLNMGVKGGLIGVVLLGLPEAAYACETCFGAGVDTPTTRGIALAMMGLLAVTGVVGAGIGAFFINMRRRSRLLEPGTFAVDEYGSLTSAEDADGPGDTR